MIDVLLSVYNGAKYLPEQIDSLIGQTYQDFRIIIRDDCSNDNSVEIIREYCAKYPQIISVIPNNGINLGSSNSFFYLLKYSTSDLIMFCDQDDVWNKDKIETMVNFYNEKVQFKNQPFIVHTAAEVVDEKLNPIEERTIQFNRAKYGIEKPFIWQIFQNDVTGCTLLTNASMRDIINKIDFSRFKVIQHDWFIAQIAYLNNAKYYLPLKTIKYRQHENNVLGAKKITLLQRVLLKIQFGTTYPYYDQIQTLLQTNIETSQKALLFEFAELKEKTKVYRICWHIKNHFFREGGFLRKTYQLIAC